MTETLWNALSYVAVNTSLLCRLLAAFFALKVTLNFLEPRSGWWRMVLLYLVHLFTSNSIVYTGVGDYLSPLLMLMFFIAGLLLFCKGRLLARFSLGIILVILPISLNAILTSVRPPFDQFIYQYITLFWGITFLVISKVMPQNRRPPIYLGRLWLLVDLLAFMPFGAVFSVIVLTKPVHLNTSPDEFRDSLLIQNEQVLLIILGLSVIASLVILASVVLLSRHEKLEEEQMLWQIRSQYYQGVEEAQQQVRRLRHDMANHFTALAGLDGESVHRYLNQLSCSPAMQKGVRYCENQVANAVLSAKLPMIEEEKIEYEWDVHLPDEISIMDIDLCAMLANGLDNAIDASLKLPEGRRIIKLNVVIDKGFFVLRLVNATDEIIQIKDGRVVTSKKEREFHGFGLTSIREIVVRYGGTVQLEYDGQEFCLLIMIPIVI